ncbi:MAG: hypothetical protein G01um101430_475 [Parcubacteria group bacterium Gr01-1014_30]|nr:MAG: hypothetical protein G01um101430_475 [Parcubacteria group bacterium Gr01-1014_30]
MDENTPTYVGVTKALETWTINHSSLSKVNLQQTAEIRRLIEQLNTTFKKLVILNEKLVLANTIRMSTDFDPETDTFTVSAGELTLSTKLKRADQKIPISFREITNGVGYLSGADSTETKEEKGLRLEMERRLEHYYNVAHRVRKLIQKLPGGKGFECCPITRCRNDLIEHVEDNHALYSFGYGSSGPRLRPAHAGLVKYNDEGLIPNTKAFVEALLKKFTS